MPQDFSHKNLRGRSFKGQDLIGANFSHSDIRGANFTNAILRNAKFINAKAGLKRCWAVGLLLGSILLAALSGFTSAFTSGIAGIGFISEQPKEIFFSVAHLITLATFYIVTIRKGLIAALETIFWATALIVTVYTAAALVVAITVVVTAAEPSAVEQAWNMVGTISESVITVGVVALQLAIIVILLAARPFAVAQAWTVAGSAGGTVVAVGAVVGAVVGGAIVTFVLLFNINMGMNTILAVLVMVGLVTSTVAMARLSAYVKRQFLAGDKKQAFVWKVAIALATMVSTRFQGADLTDADFTQATLKNTDFRKANLTRTSWFQAHRLDHVHLGDRQWREVRQ